MVLSCCCDKHGILRQLDESADDEVRYEKLLSECVRRNDEFALYLSACFSDPDNDESGSTDAYVARLKVLADQNNPWALSELGIHLLYDHDSDKEFAYGEKCLLLGALFGERRAQFYIARRLHEQEGNTPLFARLLRASAMQGYERAKKLLKDPSAS